jgi:hypothetical protein
MPMPERGAPGIFSMGTEERIRELVVGAGFGEPQVEEVPVEWRFESFEEYLRFLEEVTGVVAIVLAKLTKEQRTEVDDAIERNVASFRADGGYVMPGVALNALAS